MGTNFFVISGTPFGGINCVPTALFSMFFFRATLPKKNPKLSCIYVHRDIYMYVYMSIVQYSISNNNSNIEQNYHWLSSHTANMGSKSWILPLRSRKVNAPFAKVDPLRLLAVFPGENCRNRRGLLLCNVNLLLAFVCVASRLTPTLLCILSSR